MYHTNNLSFYSALTTEELSKFVDVNIATGLCENEIQKRLNKYGYNNLPDKPKTPLIKLLIHQFEDTLVRILLIAAFLSLFLSWIDNQLTTNALFEPCVILLILIANALVGINQEKKAEGSILALKKLQANYCLVFRNGTWNKINSIYLVVGDIIECKTGDKAPADCRIINIATTTLKVTQAELTGESYAATKTADPIAEGEDMQSLTNIIFSSTVIMYGKCTCIVIATGINTEIGKIHQSIIDNEVNELTPLEEKLEDFGNILSKIIAIICVSIWILNIKNFKYHDNLYNGCIHYVKLAIALAVAAIPEGLPAVVTTCLALGTRRMNKKNAIIRKLSSVESLGCTTVICSDKTGTLTTNEMTVTNFFYYSGTINSCTCIGSGYSVIGNITDDATGRILNLNDIGNHNFVMSQFAKCASICNESRIVQNNNGIIEYLGDSTEIALKILVEKLGVPDYNIHANYYQTTRINDPQAFCNYWYSNYKLISILEFSRKRKSMSVLVNDINDITKNILFVKGAPEHILARSKFVIDENKNIVTLDETKRISIQNIINSYASSALRTMALAYKTDLASNDYGSMNDANNFELIESDLIFLGCVGVFDPPRKEVKGAIEKCKKAGIKVFIITGDHKLTADTLGEQLVVGTDQNGKLMPHCSYTSIEFMKLSIREKKKFLNSPQGGILSRTSPNDKLQIVKLLKEMNEVVAMTGDGVNDAPALNYADISISLGKSATEVAKEASNIILADDNFNTIVVAIEEGRTIYNNMKCFIRYLISSNIGEVMAILIACTLNLPEPFTSIQLLWVNLVTDGPPAAALSFNKPEVGMMDQPPRKPDEGLVDIYSIIRYFVIGCYVGITTISVYVYTATNTDYGYGKFVYTQLLDFNNCASWHLKNDYNLTNISNPCTMLEKIKTKASSMSLNVLVLIEMFNALNALSEKNSLLVTKPSSNKYLLLAITASVALHVMVLLLPFTRSILGTEILSYNDWLVSLVFAFPVIILDEFVKYLLRNFHSFTQVKSKFISVENKIN